MATLTFYPLGNADSTLIHLNDNRLILKDYFKTESEDEDDKRVDLEEELRSYLDELGRDDFNAVAFSHADDDHCHGAENFFWFDRYEKYQGDDRIKMKQLWVPACFILETGLKGSARVIQDEARYRFKEGYGIRIFGNPGPLEKWLKGQDVEPADRRRFITKAGSCVPRYTKDTGEVEIFSHSPFSYRMEGEEVDRNGNSLVWHLTFFEGTREMRCMLGADAEHQTWADIVYVTENRGNEARLDWDLFRISHHCSYSALSEEKGEEETLPREEVASLFERGSSFSIIVSSSDPIPDKDTKQPPHMQTANYYRRKAREKGRESNFIVTMEWPDKDAPKPLVVETSSFGLTVKQRAAVAAAGIPAVTGSKSRRFGKRNGR